MKLFGHSHPQVLVDIHCVCSWSADMTGIKSSSDLDRSFLQHKQQQEVQTSLALTPTSLISSCVAPATLSTGPRIWESLSLPSLMNMAHRRTPSIIEPSSFIPVRRSLCETFHHKVCPSYKKPTSALPSKTTARPPLAYRPVYTHFSIPIRPLPRLNQVARQARSLNNSQCDLRPLGKVQQSSECQLEDLSVKGVPCFSKALPTKGPKQLHVFLPTEGATEDDNKDSESVDEGFMDELDHRVVLKKKKE